MIEVGKPSIRRNEAKLVGLSVDGNFRIGCSAKTNIPHIFRIMSQLPNQGRDRPRQILIDEELHVDKAKTRSLSIKSAA